MLICWIMDLLTFLGLDYSDDPLIRFNIVALGISIPKKYSINRIIIMHKNLFLKS